MTAGIFTDLNCFKDLEARIVSLSIEKDRGDAFEVFAEAYLATQTVAQAKEVWPQNSAPSQLLKKLCLPVSKDMGTDGLVELKDGRIASYQAKFYTGRPSLNWSILSTFFAISDRVNHTIIFTNSDTLAATVEKRKNFIAIRGTDLDKLTPQDLEVIHAWLKGKVRHAEKFAPKPHQEKALAEITNALKAEDRTTAVMACGTGKTLLALWAVERLKAKNVIVLVPSLALIQQTLNRWLRSHSLDSLAYLCVCSDASVDKGADELVVKQSDLDFEVTTEPKEVRRFIKAKLSGTKVVFSTYQSADVVGEAMRGMPAFDLGIFDEAHKTAGRDGAKFSFALKDKNLAVKKRLFLTATPRHYNVLKRDKEGDAKLVYSMDVPEIYGKVSHKLPFSEAARRGIICNYKVIISVVTSDMVDKELLRRGKVLVKGDEIQAQQVANQVALAAAVKKHGVGKIITFHRNVKAAQSFSSDGAEGVAGHLPGFKTFHVNGAMPSAERSKLMGEFETVPKALVSNARCLTEGVDVPAVDMVAFLSPRRSAVDIVQATGRAMRVAKGKETGYILVPLFLEAKKGETPEEAVKRGGFDQVWDILQALQEQDEVLADVIRQMREDRGRTKGYDDTRFKELIEVLGPSVSLDSLRASITTACINKLGTAWDEKYGELCYYKHQYGHTNVPQRWSGNISLASWVNSQRTIKARGVLPLTRKQKLDSLGFDWDPRITMWENMYVQLVAFKNTFGNCLVPNKWKTNLKLGTWVGVQRWRSEALSEDRRKRLNDLGFEWDPKTAEWNRMFNQLVNYKTKHGNCLIPRGGKHSKLSLWVLHVRHSKTHLLPTQIEKLNELEFDWNPYATVWEQKFKALAEYKKIYGNCLVPQQYKNDPKLGTWVGTLRWRRDRLSPEQVARLNSLGFEWNPKQGFWDMMFCKLEEYYQNYGNALVPYYWDKDPQLGKWVSAQRGRASSLSKEQVEKLNRIGFEWHPRKAAWYSMCAELQVYQLHYGNCDVPDKWRENKRLATWVSVQRRRRNKLSVEQISSLNKLGFNWGRMRNV